MNALKPCPFCGSYDRHVCQIPTYYKINRHVWYVKCDTCEAQGARHFTEAEATAAWNSRAERTCHDVSADSSAQFYCSECECTVDVPLLWGEVNYCPNCGAKVVK